MGCVSRDDRHRRRIPACEMTTRFGDEAGASLNCVPYLWQKHWYRLKKVICRMRKWLPPGTQTVLRATRIRSGGNVLAQSSGNISTFMPQARNSVLYSAMNL